MFWKTIRGIKLPRVWFVDRVEVKHHTVPSFVKLHSAAMSRTEQLHEPVSYFRN